MCCCFLFRLVFLWRCRIELDGCVRKDDRWEVGVLVFGLVFAIACARLWSSICFASMLFLLDHMVVYSAVSQASAIWVRIDFCVLFPVACSLLVL